MKKKALSFLLAAAMILSLGVPALADSEGPAAPEAVEDAAISDNAAPASEPAAEEPASEPAAEEPAPEPAAEEPAPEPAAEEPAPESEPESVPAETVEPEPETEEPAFNPAPGDPDYYFEIDEDNCAEDYHDIDAGDTTDLYIHTNCADPGRVSYTWQKKEDDGNWVDIGIDTPLTTLEGNLCTTGASGQYRCGASDGVSTLWREFNVYVYNIQSSSTSDEYVSYGGTLTLSFEVEAYDTTDMTYQWYRSLGGEASELLSGETGATLTLSNVTESHDYYCALRDRFGNKYEIPFHICPDTNLTASAVSSLKVFAAEGESVTFEAAVTADISTDQLTLRWYDSNWNLIAGSEGQTSWTVTGGGNQTYHFCAQDPFDSYATVDFQVLDAGSIQELALGEDTTAEITSDVNEVFFRFTPSVTGSYALSSSAAGQDTYCTLYNASFNEIASDDDSGEQLNFRLSRSLTAGQTYYYGVRYYSGNTGSIPVRLTKDNNFSVSTADAIVLVDKGADTTLRAYLNGDDLSQVTCVWEKWDDDNGQYVPVEGGALSASGTTRYATLTVPNVQGMAEYRCTASDGFGASMSANFTVGVDTKLKLTAVGPQRMFAAETASVTLSVSATAVEGTTINLAWSADGYTIPDSTNQASVTVAGGSKTVRCVASDQYGSSAEVVFTLIDTRLLRDIALNTPTTATIGSNGGYAYFRFVPEVTDDYLFASQSDRDTYGYLYDANLNEITRNDDGGENSNFCIQDTLVAGQTYYFGVRYYSSYTGDIPVLLSKDNHFRVGFRGSDTVCVEAGEDATITPLIFGDDLSRLSCQWYELDRNGNWTAIENATGTSYTVENVRTKTSLRFTASDGLGGSGSLYFDVKPANRFVASAVENPVLVPYGGDAKLEVNADSADGVLTYKWYHDGPEGLLENATGATLTVSNVTSGPDYYRCEVTDSTGDTREIQFRVGLENNFRAAPANGEKTFTVDAGSTLTLKVDASCRDGALSYSWSAEHVSSGTDTLVLSNVQSNQWIYCTVSDDFGNSAEIEFHVMVNAGFTYAPEKVVSLVNGAATLTAEFDALGASVPEYAWFVREGNGTNAYRYTQITDANGPSLTVSGLTGSGEYYCHANDQFGNGTRQYFRVVEGVPLTLARDEEYESYESVFLVPCGGSATLSVEVLQSNGGLQYQWYTDDMNGTQAIPGATSSSYTVTNVTEWVGVYCEVTDASGQQQSAWFSVGVDNALVLTPIGNYTVREETYEEGDGGLYSSSSWTETWYVYDVPANSPTEIGVTVSAADMDGLIYHWSWSGGESSYGPSGSEIAWNRPTLPIARVTGSKNYYLEVTDRFGNYKSVQFKVNAVKPDINGLADIGDGWKYYVHGDVDTSFTGLAYREDIGWWYVENGAINFSYTGLAENEYGWWYVTNGQLDLTYTGLATNENGTFYIYKGQFANWRTGCEWVNGEYCEFYLGQLTTWKTDATVVNPSGDGQTWVAMRCGKVDPSYTGLAYNENGWWYLTDGSLDFSFTGLVTNPYGTWFIYKGQLANWRTGYDTVNGEVYEFENGQLCEWHSELVLYGGEWLYLNKGHLDLHYTGLAENANGWWYVFDGHMDFTFTGLVPNEYGTWYVYLGQLTTWIEDWAWIDGTFYKIYKGQLCEWESGTYDFYGTPVIVEKGVVVG